MDVNWNDVLTTIGSTAVIVAAFGWLVKFAITELFKRNLEAHKAQLKHASDRDLKTYEDELKRATEIKLAQFDQDGQAALLEQTASFERQMLKFQAEVTAESARSDRVRQEIERWANPILGAVRDLQARLRNILSDIGYVALSRKPLADATPPQDWAIRYDYFLPSTVFLFCQYFCWVRLLRERLNFDLFSESAEKDRFFSKVRAVNGALSRWPLEELKDVVEIEDLQVFTLQQRALGETLVEGQGDDAQCMRFATFLDRWADNDFKSKFEPMEKFVDGLTPYAARRWRRLQLMHSALGELRAECERILAPSDRATADGDDAC